MTEVIPLAELPNDAAAIAFQISAALGIKLHFVETMRFEINRNIINGTASEGACFISHPTHQDHILWVIGHEMWHAGEQTDLELFETSLFKILNDCHPALVEFRRQFEPDKTVSDRHVQSEILADFNGEMWIDPIFWLDLANTTKNQKAIELFSSMEVILKSEQAVGRFGLQYYNLDRADLRKDLVDVWAPRLAKV